ncbi:MAG: hypothetical protein FWG90_07590 [Oscillospiraceae bacterium]|nr:hypothetical protein [Oscillospiraceae bacterium]
MIIKLAMSLVAMLFLLTSCNEIETIDFNSLTDGARSEVSEKVPGEKYIFNDENTLVFEVEPLQTANLVSNMWDYIAEEDCYIDSDLIARGFITNQREVAVSYDFMDVACVTYLTLVDVEITEAFYSANDRQAGENITISISSSSYALDESIPPLVTGAEYILFASDSNLLLNDESMQIRNYTDYYVSSPYVMVVPIFDEVCLIDPMLSSYIERLPEPSELLPGEIITSNIVHASYSTANETDYVMVVDFENSLINKINTFK